MKITVENLKNIGVQEGWLDGINNNMFIDTSIIDCIKNCTSPVNIKDKINKKENVTKEDLQIIFKAFSLFPLSATRILIIGQDPYPESGKAEGLAFSVKEDYNAIDESLLNIYEAAGVNVTNKTNKSLIEWAKRNQVLLLNTALTYQKLEDVTEEKQEHCQKEHINAWNPFIIKIISNLIKHKIDANNKLAVFLWGEKAQNVFFQSLNELNKEGNYNPIIKLFEGYNILNKRSKQILKLKKINNVITGCKQITNIALYMTYHPSKRYNKGMRIFLEQTPSHFKCCDKFLDEGETEKLSTWLKFPEDNEPKKK